MGNVEDSARRMIETVAAAEWRSPREILARQFRGVTLPDERAAAVRPAPVPVERWFDVAALERQQQRAAAHKAAAKKRAIARKAHARKQRAALSSPPSEKHQELEGVAITAASFRG